MTSQASHNERYREDDHRHPERGERPLEWSQDALGVEFTYLPVAEDLATGYRRGAPAQLPRGR